ncbi:hypothetical protein [Hydrogenophaga sp. BPS33]|uniref:hypothetical protein n=1 Tax=Hydrogenophaga sp. BPS33 TaxID=2651974 RepID=UPI00131F97B9|nr:hypothetical protein [Hydrogenophaga sp. BPS33]QHE87225.1 hypothetical protein F9K07_21150 [Hydrogenophaga sp. BPS33]
MSEAEDRFRGIFDLKAGLPENDWGTLYGAEVWLPGPSDSCPASHHVLFVRADHYEKAELLSKCSLPLQDINLKSENLEYKESFAFLGPEDDAIYIPLWHVECLNICEGQSVVRIVFIGRDWVIDMRHHLSGDDLDGYLVGWQALTNTSGPNYNACIEHSDAEFEEVKGRRAGFSIPGEVVLLRRAGTERH